MLRNGNESTQLGKMTVMHDVGVPRYLREVRDVGGPGGAAQGEQYSHARGAAPQPVLRD